MTGGQLSLTHGFSTSNVAELNKALSQMKILES